MLSLVGVPGIYFHSLFGSRGWAAGVAQTQQNRTINREKLERAGLDRELRDPGSQRQKIFKRYTQLLRVRAAHTAFDPFGDQRIADCGDAIFALERIARRGDERVLCLHNVSAESRTVHLAHLDATGRWNDLLTGQSLDAASGLTLSPYQTVWLVRADV
jgi:glucosylglycerate phosphorylase